MVQVQQFSLQLENSDIIFAQIVKGKRQLVMELRPIFVEHVGVLVWTFYPSGERGTTVKKKLRCREDRQDELND